ARLSDQCPDDRQRAERDVSAINSINTMLLGKAFSDSFHHAVTRFVRCRTSGMYRGDLTGREPKKALGRSIHVLAQFLAVRTSPMIPNCFAASTPFFSMNTCARFGIFAPCTARPTASRTQGPGADIISGMS